MVRASQQKGKRKRAVRFRGITRAAADLGVERSHLYRVLSGQRESRSLMRRFQEWEKEQAQEVTK